VKSTFRSSARTAAASVVPAAAAGTTDAAAVRAELLKVDFTGASKQVSYQENGDSGSNYTVYQVKDGKFVPYWNSLSGEKY